MTRTILTVVASIDGEPLDSRDVLVNLTNFFRSRGKQVSRGLNTLDVTSPQNPSQKLHFRLIQIEEPTRRNRGN